MPQVELKYSTDLELDAHAIFDEIERAVLQADPTTGGFKFRAYPTEIFKNSHIFVDITILPKAHRDRDFCNKLSAEIARKVKQILETPCQFSLSLQFANEYYLSEKFTQ